MNGILLMVIIAVTAFVVGYIQDRITKGGLHWVYAQIIIISLVYALGGVYAIVHDTVRSLI